MRPLVVVEASELAFRDAVREIERLDVPVVRGWRNVDGVICTGTVATPDDAAAVVLAAVAGAGIVAHATAPREIVDRLVDDLRRLGPVEHRLDEPNLERRLTRDEEALLELLAEGATLGAAAAQLHLSRRTADRRLASAKAKLGASSTAHALVAFRRAR